MDGCHHTRGLGGGHNVPILKFEYENIIPFGRKQAVGGKAVRWNVLEMACHRMGAIIGHPKTVYNGHNTFRAEPELDSCIFVC